METGKIPDNKISAKTEGSNSTAKNGRLHYTSGSSWCASTNTDQYLQLDLGTTYVICAVATQGNSKAEQWVVTYQLQSSTDGTTWTDYKEGGQVRVSTDLPHIMKLWPFRISMNQSNGMELWRKREIILYPSPQLFPRQSVSVRMLLYLVFINHQILSFLHIVIRITQIMIKKIRKKRIFLCPWLLFS